MVQVTYPGVYIQEIPSGVHTITSVATSITAFIDFFKEGPMNQAVEIFGMTDFQRVFGGLDDRSEASYAIAQFFLNGGSTALVIRCAAKDATHPLAIAGVTMLNAAAGVDLLQATAVSEGVWGNNLRIDVDLNTSDPTKLFNLTVTRFDGPTAAAQPLTVERHLNLAVDKTSTRYVVAVVNDQSNLIRIKHVAAVADLAKLPMAQQYQLGLAADVGAAKTLSVGGDGKAPGATEIIGDPAAEPHTGMYALDYADLFNILCIPCAAKLANDSDMVAVVSAALKYCGDRRAFMIIDLPESKNDTQKVKDWLDAHGSFRNKNAALYFPHPRIPDPMNEFCLRTVGASGTMAGIYSRTDSERGVWKAPAGIEAVLDGVVELDTKLTDAQNGTLNPLAINCLRSFPIYGGIAWGARTLEGADQMASEWKYIPIRRLALMLEESLFRGTKWVVFEPNDEPLWANIRLNIGAYMMSLFRQGAFQGTSPKDAFFVKCDAETTTQDDRNKGIVNILVGFAPLKPAEFVVIGIQQIAGQL